MKQQTKRAGTFGRTCEYVILAYFKNEKWQPFEIVPESKAKASLLSNFGAYGKVIFEGMKAHFDRKAFYASGWADNHSRFLASGKRMFMQVPDWQYFSEAITSLVQTHGFDFMRNSDASAIYLQPRIVDITESLNPTGGKEYAMVIPMFELAYSNENLFSAMVASYPRAFPGGTGAAKTGANYANACLADEEARKAGCDTVLWLDALEKSLIEECGTTNVFFRHVETGQWYTPPLSDTIIAGTTRATVISLLGGRNVRVNDAAAIPLDWVLSDAANFEVFLTGTGAGLKQLGEISHKGKVFPLSKGRETFNFLWSMLLEYYQTESKTVIPVYPAPLTLI